LAILLEEKLERRRRLVKPVAMMRKGFWQRLPAFFPSEDPKYVLIINLDEPEDRMGREPRRTAGYTAVPVAAEVIRRVAPLLGLAPKTRGPLNEDLALTNE
jgi:hypothetical protein